ncbi:MAG: hypothetical protein RIF41_09480 [Polyangiaceae bacterium]
MHRLAACVATFAFTACATAPSPAPSHAPTERSVGPVEEPAPVETAAPAATEEAPAAPDAEDDTAEAFPTTCEQVGPVCRPPEAFAERLCKSAKPDVALAMFHGSTPWTRAYVRGDMEAWYASARRSRPYRLRYAEEVIVVASRQRSGAIQVSGSGSYDVVRWDGSCVSLMEGELSFRRPSDPDVAPIQWKRLDDRITSTLAKHPAIAYRNGKRRDACKGFGASEDSRCEHAETMLSRKIAEYVRAGGELPTITR